MPKRRELQQEKICKVIKITAVKEMADKWHTAKNLRRVWRAHGEIEARKEHEFAAPTYRDTAALAEIRQDGVQSA